MKRLMLALCLLPSWAGAATYYVDCSAGAGGDGSLATPWDAIADVNAASFSAGDSILFKRGCTFTAQLVPPSSGSAGNYITFSAYGDGAAPIIDGAATVDQPLNINAKDYLIVENLLLKRGSNSGQGVIFIQGGADHVIIRNNEIGPSSQMGVQFQYNAGGYNQILNNTIHNNARNGVSAYIHTGSTNDASRTVISGNEVYSNGEDGIHIRADYWTVEYNHVYNNGSAGEYIGIHGYTLNLAEGVCDSAIIRYNRVHDQTGNGNDGAGIALDQWCDDALVYYNIAYANDGPGFYGLDAPNLTLYNNTSYGNCQNSSGELTLKAEIRLDSTVSDLQTATIKNNIAVATMADTYAIYADSETYDNTLDITNNVWYASAANWYFWNASGGSDIATWEALTGVGHDQYSNPRFIDADVLNFHLQPESIAIDFGVDVSLTKDFDGKGFRGGIPDSGAFEDANLRTSTTLGGVVGISTGGMGGGSIR